MNQKFHSDIFFSFRIAVDEMSMSGALSRCALFQPAGMVLLAPGRG